MGSPRHYSLELPDRCLTLIEELMPIIRGSSPAQIVLPFPRHRDGVRSPRTPHLGPLSTTFLLAMATPIIGLPVERIFKAEEEGTYIDDRTLDPRLAEVVTRILRKSRLRDTDFFEAGAWRFAQTPLESEKLGGGVPDGIAAQLDGDDATERAANLPTGDFVRWLRNALAHGGVYYLDENGRTTHGLEAKMLLFVSAKYDPRGSKDVVALRLLRITELGFESFLKAWATWLVRSGVWHAVVAEAA